MNDILTILNIGFLVFLLLFIIKQSKMSQELDALKAAIENDITVENSAITLLHGLKTQLDAAIAAQPADDGAALQALSTSLGASTTALAAAVAANTPVAATPASAAETTPPAQASSSEATAESSDATPAPAEATPDAAASTDETASS
jgi:cell division septation protein DedD